MSRPLLLDLFCGAGGAAVGYHRAGFGLVCLEADRAADDNDWPASVTDLSEWRRQ